MLNFLEKPEPVVTEEVFSFADRHKHSLMFVLTEALNLADTSGSKKTSEDNFKLTHAYLDELGIVLEFFAALMQSEGWVDMRR